MAACVNASLVDLREELQRGLGRRRASEAAVVGAEDAVSIAPDSRN